MAIMDPEELDTNPETPVEAAGEARTKPGIPAAGVEARTKPGMPPPRGGAEEDTKELLNWVIIVWRRI